MKNMIILKKKTREITTRQNYSANLTIFFLDCLKNSSYFSHVFMSIAGGMSFGECKKVYESHDDSFNVTTRTVTSTSFIMIINRVDGSTWGQNMEVHWLAFE